MKPRRWSQFSLTTLLAVMSAFSAGLVAGWLEVSQPEIGPMIVLSAPAVLLLTVLCEATTVSHFYGIYFLIVGTGVLYSLYAFALTTFRLRVAVPLVLGVQTACGLVLLAWSHWRG